MENSNIKIMCCWCQEQADTTEVVLVEGVFPVHSKCKDPFVEDQLKAGYLPLKSRYGIAPIQQTSMTEDVKIVQEEMDPHGVNRISMGGVKGVGFYVVLRGERKDNIAIIKRCLDVLEKENLRDIKTDKQEGT